MTTVEKKKLRVFGAGGAGINLAKVYQSTQLPLVLDPGYIDTSSSNLSESNLDAAYLISNLDGSGKVRGLNVNPIRKHIPSALSKLTPTDFNLVAFSASGGSGSVIGPLIVEELLERDKLVVLIVIGDTDSAVATKNTLNTIKTLSSLSAKQEKAISIIYQEMTNGSQRRAVDEVVHKSIAAFSQLYSIMAVPGSEFDTMDLTHWLHYPKATTHTAGLGLINILDSNDKLQEQQDALSVASIYGSVNDEHGDVQAQYRTTGYSQSDMSHPLHFVITQRGLTAIAESLQRKLDDHAKHANHLASQHVVLHDTRAADDDFLIVD